VETASAEKAWGPDGSRRAECLQRVTTLPGKIAVSPTGSAAEARVAGHYRMPTTVPRRALIGHGRDGYSDAVTPDPGGVNVHGNCGSSTTVRGFHVPRPVRILRFAEPAPRDGKVAPTW